MAVVGGDRDALVAILQRRVSDLEAVLDALEASRREALSAASTAARTTVIAIERLQSLKELADAAVAWREDLGTTIRSDVEARLWKLVDRYRIQLSNQS